MSKITINKKIEIDGTFMIEANCDYSSNPPVIDINGTLITEHDEYLDEIERVENERYFIEGCRVFREIYSSESNEIEYHFSARSYGMK